MNTERDAVMIALLHELAGDQHILHHRSAGRKICVEPVLGAAPMAGSRQPSPRDMKFDAPIGQPRRPWRPDSEEEARNRLWWFDPTLDAAESGRQRAIQNAALAASERAPASPETNDRVERRWLAPNQSLGTSDCVETQRFSEPDIALDHAFVNVTLDCGALCGLGALFVLRREGGGWRVVDGRTHFIS